MTDLQFNDQQDEFGRPPQASAGTDFTGKLVSWGLASNRQQAEYIMMGLAVLVVLIAGYFFFSGGESSPPLLPN